MRDVGASTLQVLLTRVCAREGLVDREWEGAGSFRRRAGTLSLACLQAAWLCLADLEGDHCPLLRNRIPGTAESPHREEKYPGPWN